MKEADDTIMLKETVIKLEEENKGILGELETREMEIEACDENNKLQCQKIVKMKD